MLSHRDHLVVATFLVTKATTGALNNNNPVEAAKVDLKAVATTLLLVLLLIPDSNKLELLSNKTLNCSLPFLLNCPNPTLNCSKLSPKTKKLS